jgi:hypothetical protein
MLLGLQVAWRSSAAPPPIATKCAGHRSLPPPRSARSTLVVCQGDVKTRGKAQTKGAPAVAESCCWRVFGVGVPAAADPGKDAYGAHPALLKALEKKLGCRQLGALTEESVTIVRKSFDAR